MKPDDILNAIGEVDDKYIKRAHRKDFLKAICGFLATFILLAFLSELLMEQDYVLARFQPDGQPNTGYVDLMHMEKAKWTTMEYTAFQGGKEISKTVFARSLLGNYTINHKEAGQETKLIGKSGNREYLGSYTSENLYMETTYHNDLIGRVDSILVRGKNVYPGGSRLLNYLTIEYLDTLYLTRQNRMDNLDITAYRTFSYQHNTLINSKDYDGAGTLLGYTDYHYDGSAYEAVSYDADGSKTGMLSCETDRLGRIKTRVYYDAEGNLTGVEHYSYHFWERYRGIVGLSILLISVSLSALIGVSIYEDRIPLKKKESFSAAFPNIDDNKEE